MSLPVFQTTVVNGTGDILTAATVTVTVEATGAAAVLFSDRNGTIGLGSGGVFSVNGTTAFAQFFAAPGEYRIEANDAVSGFSETWRYQVLSGTASLANKQTSSTDTTTGALLAVGAFGLGSTASNNVPDLNSVTATSIGSFVSASTNRPASITEGTVQTNFYGVGFATQAAKSVIDDIQEERRQVAGVWISWKRVYTSANLNPDKFGNKAGGYVAAGVATSSGTASFEMPISRLTAPSVTISGDFQIVIAGGAVVTGGATSTPSVNVALTSPKSIVVDVSFLGGLTTGQYVEMRANSLAYIEAV